MKELRDRASKISELLGRASELELDARNIQASRPSTWSDEQLRKFRNRYQDWYASALVLLPDDSRDSFIKEFKNGRFFRGIEAFIAAPAKPNIIFSQAALENPDAVSSLYWQHPVETTFETKLLNQQGILREARERYTILSTRPEQTIPGLLDGPVAVGQSGISESSSDASAIHSEARTGSIVFVAHGRSPIYLEVYHHLKNELELDAVAFETESHTSEQVSQILTGFLEQATAAVIVMTGEDKTIENRLLARQNVVHEAGLFQARLGFDRVVLLKEVGVESFSNAQGLIYIPFDPLNIKGCFYDLRRFLAKLDLVSK